MKFGNTIVPRFNSGNSSQKAEIKEKNIQQKKQKYKSKIGPNGKIKQKINNTIKTNPFVFFCEGKLQFWGSGHVFWGTHPETGLHLFFLFFFNYYFSFFIFPFGPILDLFF